ncbi:MAG: hypothetical protein PUC65_17385 [Clostridiales bacterium]|nr:hypothetical protein [Clostridiales bacterium]
MKTKEVFFLLLCFTFAISTALMMIGSIFEIVTCTMVGYTFLWISAMILIIRYFAVQKKKNRNFYNVD